MLSMKWKKVLHTDVVNLLIKAWFSEMKWRLQLSWFSFVHKLFEENHTATQQITFCWPLKSSVYISRQFESSCSSLYNKRNVSPLIEVSRVSLNYQSTGSSSFLLLLCVPVKPWRHVVAVPALLSFRHLTALHVVTYGDLYMKRTQRTLRTVETVGGAWTGAEVLPVMLCSTSFKISFI